MFLIYYTRLHQNYYYYLCSGSSLSSAIIFRNEAALWSAAHYFNGTCCLGEKIEYATRGNTSCKTPIALVFVVKVNPACKEHNLLIILCSS